MNPGSRPSGSATRLQHITLPAPPHRPTVTIREQGSGSGLKQDANTLEKKKYSILKSALIREIIYLSMNRM